MLKTMPGLKAAGVPTVLRNAMPRMIATDQRAQRGYAGKIAERERGCSKS